HNAARSRHQRRQQRASREIAGRAGGNLSDLNPVGLLHGLPARVDGVEPGVRVFPPELTDPGWTILPGSTRRCPGRGGPPRSRGFVNLAGRIGQPRSGRAAPSEAPDGFLKRAPFLRLLSMIPRLLGKIPRLLGKIPRLLGKIPRLLSKIPRLLGKIP